MLRNSTTDCRVNRPFKVRRKPKDDRRSELHLLTIRDSKNIYGFDYVVWVGCVVRVFSTPDLGLVTYGIVVCAGKA